MANSMRARTVFVILLVLILLVAFGSALVAVGSQEIAALVFGCEVNLNYSVPCVIGGKGYGQALYDLGFAIWYSYLTIPAGVVLFCAVDDCSHDRVSGLAAERRRKTS
jgi:hypothetical protein